MLGMLIVGILLYMMLRTTGHYYVEGVGYATIQDILTGQITSTGLLLLLLFLKFLVTSITLGSGASGGIFSPSLFLGATLGAAYGSIMRLLIPGIAVSTPGFAVAGMAASVAGTTGAVLTGIVMVAEMTLDYKAILPITLTAAIAYGVHPDAITAARKLALERGLSPGLPLSS
jgi:CIC family chloride channel protein